MRLLPFSNSSATLDFEIEVAHLRRLTTLSLTYTVEGDGQRLRLPENLTATRADGLWQHTCFEAFVRPSRCAGYWEFNFSPSRQWAAYRFDGYREGMAAEQHVGDPHIELQSDEREFRLSAALDFTRIPEFRANEDWRLGLSAVLEDADGRKSYWALAHPSERPDFHHPQGFVLALPAQSGT